LTAFSLTSGSLLLPILVYAYLASSFDKDAAYALHDLANLCKNLRERRDCSCVTWDPAKQESLMQRQEQQDREHEQLRKRQSIKSEMSVNASISVPPLSAATPYDFRDVGAAMSRFSLPVKLSFCAPRDESFVGALRFAISPASQSPTKMLAVLLKRVLFLQLPRMQHFRKQLITPTVGGQRLSVIDHIEALSPADLLALEVSVRHALRISCGSALNLIICRPCAAAFLKISGSSPAPAVFSASTSTARSWRLSSPSCPV
jgi:hypothetical protein